MNLLPSKDPPGAVRIPCPCCGGRRRVPSRVPLLWWPCDYCAGQGQVWSEAPLPAVEPAPAYEPDPLEASICALRGAA